MRSSESTSIDDLSAIDWAQVEWKEELSRNVKTTEELRRYLPSTGTTDDDLGQIIDLHPMNIPRYYLSLVDPRDPNDPIRRLCVPESDELVVAGMMGETTKDPYGDDKHDKGNGILHKYRYTALVVATGYCAMYCRHCFRKRLVGLPNDKTVENFREAARYIADHPEITNVVVSGGDPLMLPTPVIRSMLDELRHIPHLDYVRVGSRAPVVNPMRFFEDELVTYLKEFNRDKTLYVPTHYNHPRELTATSVSAVRRLREIGITVNNQAVLLRGVNDTADTLQALMSGMVRAGVNPYYLYQCMPVARVRHHFQVPLKEGVDLVDKVRQRLDGYAKRFKFIIGHDIGKLEICGRVADKLILKQIHARCETPDEASRMLIRQLDAKAGWLDDLTEIAL